MNRKQLGLLIMACVVIGAVGLFLSKRKQASWDEAGAELGQKLLKDFPINDVAQLRIKSHDAEVNVVKKGDDWVVKERGEYPANFGEVIDVLRKFLDLKVAQPQPITQAQLGRLELLPTDKATNSGTLVECKDAGGKMLAFLTLGKKHMKQAKGESQFGGGAWPDGRYVMVGDDPKKVSLIADVLSNLEPKPEQWLNKDFFKVEKLKAVTVVAAQATNNFKLTRETESGEWKLADAKGDEKADSGKVSGMNYLLNSPSFNDVALNWSFNDTNKPTTTATLQTFENFTYGVKLASKGGDDYYLNISVNAELPKERTGVSTNETKEVKEKLDKEFKEKKEKLGEKLKAEQSCGKWTYVVSKFTVDNLLKERKDLLAEKKEEPKKDDAKPAEPKKDETKKDAGPADSLVPTLEVK
jgi:hypothetical protein